MAYDFGRVELVVVGFGFVELVVDEAPGGGAVVVVVVVSIGS